MLYLFVFRAFRFILDSPNSNETSVEYVTYPNNPDGELRKAKLSDDSRVIYDMVYNFPFYNSESKWDLSHDIMVFSASKLSGNPQMWPKIERKSLTRLVIEIFDDSIKFFLNHVIRNICQGSSDREFIVFFIPSFYTKKFDLVVRKEKGEITFNSRQYI